MPLDKEEEIANLDRKEDMAASNDTGASQTFYDRILFKNYAYSNISAYQNSKEILPIRDFQKFENYLYGRIDTEFQAVTPRKNALSAIGDSSETALSFAASSFDAMAAEITRDTASGKIPPGIPFISDMKAHSAYRDINVDYNGWVRNFIKDDFINYVKEYNKGEDIVDFESFLGVFKEHLLSLIGNLGSATFSSFCLGYKSNIKNSGLCIDIADLDFSKDSDKIKFSETPYFTYYLNLASKYGFFVDYNAPWRLIYNLRSHRAGARDGIDGLYTFFGAYFEKSHRNDLKILKNTVFTAYTAFVNNFRSFRKMTVEPGGCIRKELVVRQKHTLEEFEKNYPDRYWLGFYIDLKNAEKNLDFDRGELERIKRKSLEYEKHIDILRAMSYINKVFQDIPSVEGSYYYELNKLEYRDRDPLPFEEFDRYIQEVVKSYKLK
jgi:hypothetical protein